MFQEVLFCIVSLQVMAPSSRRRLSVKSRFVVVACLVAGHGSESRLRRLSVKSGFVAVSGLIASRAEFLEMWSTLGRFLELFYSNLVQKHEAEETISKKNVRDEHCFKKFSFALSPCRSWLRAPVCDACRSNRASWLSLVSLLIMAPSPVCGAGRSSRAMWLLLVSMQAMQKFLKWGPLLGAF